MKGVHLMFNKIKNKVNQIIDEAEEKRKERERLEKERLEEEKKSLLALSEKELLVELLITLKNMESDQKSLLEKISELDSDVSYLRYKND